MARTPFMEAAVHILWTRNGRSSSLAITILTSYSCSTLAIILHAYVTDGRVRAGVSQSLTMTYHSPALPYVLPIVPVNKYSSVQRRRAQDYQYYIIHGCIDDGCPYGGALSSIFRPQANSHKIWNATRNRLVVTGVHIKMDPKQPKAKM